VMAVRLDVRRAVRFVVRSFVCLVVG